jgi:predicted Ser/Thr protein kinase
MSQASTADCALALDTGKNRVLVYHDSVHKTFKVARNARRNARRELKALRLLAGLDGVPLVLAANLDQLTVVMSRIPGKPLTECGNVAEHTMRTLRKLVEQMLQRGVARHSLPPRDVIVANDGSAGLVDFERSTRRLFPFDPSWAIAKAVTRFHLLRLVNQHAPQLLTLSEQRRLRWQTALRAALQRPGKLRRRVVRALSPAR